MSLFRSASLLVVCAAALVAQTNFGRISGTVSDPSGAVVPGAAVAVTNLDTQALRAVTADEHGFYVVENLPIGPYSVTVRQPGFKDAEQRGLNLVADGRLSADFHLQIGEAGQSIEIVEVQKEVLNTVSGEVAHVVDKEQVDNLALNGRNYMELLTLVPGAIVTNPDQFSVNTSLSATQQTVNGHRTNQNNMTVDGLGNLDAGANGSLINNISPDFIQEVKIQTSNFSAEYGRSAGASFGLMTKNGTNALHGGLFEYFRNDKLDARNFFSPDKQQLRFNDFGWNLGGPIKKNKLFFFVGEEWKRLRQQAAPTRVTLPTTDQMNGIFGTRTIYQPGTKTPFPGSTIPANLITADGRAIMNVYRTVIPLTASFTNTAISNNAIFQNQNPLDYREDIGRVDYRINDRHSLMGRWVDDYNSIYLATGPGGSIPITPEIRDRPGKSALLSETWVISPTLVNEAHVGASWNSQHYWNQGDTWQRSTQGFQFQRLYNSVGAYPNGIPDVSITSFTAWQGPYRTLASPTTQIELGDTLSIVRGQHSLRAGATVIRNRKDQNGRSPYTGNITFNTTGNPNTTGYALSDALLGNFNTYTEAAYDPMGKYRYTQPSLFVTDSWKVSRKLSLDLGLRWEYFMAMYSTADNLSEFVPSLFDPAKAVKLNSSGNVVPGSGDLYNGLQRVAGGVNPSQAYLVPNANDPAVQAVPTGAPRGMYPSQAKWEPRVGFAYALNDSTVIRGGFGLFYDRIQGNPTFYTLNNPPYVGSASYYYSNLNNIAGGSTVLAPWGTIQTIDPNLKVPYSEQFSFGVQRQLPFSLFGEANYVGTLSRHLLVEPDINQPSWYTLSTVASTANLNTIRPYPGYSTIQMFMSAGTGNYHGLQMRLARRVGAVQITASYTWSKNLTDAHADTENRMNAFNLKTMYGPAYSTSSAGSMDIRHAFVGTYIWYLPKLKNQKMWLRGPVGGWQLSGIVRLQTGPYQTVTANTNVLGNRVADYIGGPVVLSDPGPNGWINAAAFAAAPQDRWGLSGAGNVQGPGLAMFNLSVTKFFYLKADSKANIRVRADFVNAFNHTNFQQPSTNLSSSGFGTITGAYPPRNIQLGMKLSF
ncbi:MAG: TonB-dependent receptor [Acidobacteria bacterium]|nr:TonB-dependent receptor [Acidobacteriota bacterium]